MIDRTLTIGRWVAEFYFAEEGYDVDALLDRMFDFGATASTMRQAMELMESGALNTGFTFSNPYERVAIVAIGPTTDGEEFGNTLAHELFHLTVSITESLGIDLNKEAPAYLMGDTFEEFIDTICKLGCDRCRSHKKRQ